ncbi:SMC family ATPase, partial [Bacillus licheniformis]|nr:SMC family ATPase [Bacillus licheniformis]
QDVKTQLAKLHEQEQTLYGRLKETESEVSRLRGQTKGCELALREAEARLAKAADIWQEKAGGTPFEKASEVKASILDRDELSRLKEDIQLYWDHTKQCESNIKRITEKLDGRSVSEENWEKAAVTKDQAEEAFSKALEERGAAGKALAVIRENHKRFKELETSLAEWQ